MLKTNESSFSWTAGELTLTEHCLQAGMSHLSTNALLALHFEVGLHDAVALLIDLMSSAPVTSTATHIHTTSVSSCVQATLSEIK